MKNIFIITAIISIVVLNQSCRKSTIVSDPPTVEPQEWQFTQLVNISEDDSLYAINFYQKKGEKWRVVRMAPDDYTTFYLHAIDTPDSYSLPVANPQAFFTSNNRFFDPTGNDVYRNHRIKRALGTLPVYDARESFSILTPHLPSKWTNIGTFQGATYSKEYPYDSGPVQDTYIFFDFKNEKYVYYGNREGADLVIDNYSLSDICSGCDIIDWKKIDAVAAEKGYTGYSANYYFFDFDKMEFYILFRENLLSNNPKFTLASTKPLKMSEQMRSYYVDGDKPFDFKK